MIKPSFEILNQKGTPMFYSDVYANIPTAGIVGRMFISTDTYAFYRDTGSGWDLIGGPGTGTITGSGATGQVSFFSGSSVLSGSNNLFWDSANNRLGIGTSTPGVPLDIHTTGTGLSINGTSTNNAFQTFQNAGTGKWRIGNNYSAGSNYFSIYDVSNTTERLKIENTGAGTYTGAYTVTGNLTSNSRSYAASGFWATGGTSVSGTLALVSQTNNLSTWQIGTVGAIGVNSGANFYLYNYKDDGTPQTIMIADRASGGSLAISVPTTISSTLTMGSGSQISGGGILKVGNATLNNGSAVQFLGWQTLGYNWQIDTGYISGLYLSIAPSTAIGGSTFTTPIVYFSQTGQIGIGATPTRKLTISGNGSQGASTGACIRLDNTTSGRPGIIDFDDSQNLNFVASTDSGVINFYTGTGTSTIKAFISNSGVINAASFVPTSSTVPSNGMYLSAANTIDFATNTTKALTLDSGGVTIMRKNAKVGNTGSSASAVITFQNSANGFDFGFNSTTTQRFTFVNGGASEVGYLTGAGVFFSTGGGTSDIRTKKNIEYIQTGLDKILMLQPAMFEFIIDEGKKRRGFIAQDVLKVIPDLVLGNGDEENGIYGLDYDGILSLAVKAIQELKAEIDKLKN